MSYIAKVMFVEFTYRGDHGITGAGDAYIEYNPGHLTPEVMRKFKLHMKDEVLREKGIDVDIIITHHIMLDDVIQEGD